MKRLGADPPFLYGDSFLRTAISLKGLLQNLPTIRRYKTFTGVSATDYFLKKEKGEDGQKTCWSGESEQKLRIMKMFKGVVRSIERGGLGGGWQGLPDSNCLELTLRVGLKENIENLNDLHQSFECRNSL